MLVLLALASFVIGTLIGGTGVGGVLLIPALMFFGGLGTHQAMATALFSFFFAGILATWIYQRYGSIDWRISLPVLVASFISSYAGASLAHLATARQLNILLATIIIVSTVYSLLPKRSNTLASTLTKGQNTALLFGIGLFTGFFCGMTGAGGGIISVPTMLIFGYATLPTIATSQVLQSVISTSGSVSNIANGYVDFSIVWWVTVCELAGIALGVRIAHKVPQAILKKAVSLFCMLIGLVIAFKAFSM